MGSRNAPLEPHQIDAILRRGTPTGWKLRGAQARNVSARLMAGWSGRMIALVERIGSSRAVECPICGWTGLRFRPFSRGGRVMFHVVCPGCRSMERHRLFYLAWTAERRPSDVTLHFAPEKWLENEVRRDARRVVTLDLSRAGVDVCADAEQLPLPAAKVDVAVCNDVLEHVRDDRRALSELRRVLQSDGLVMIHIPLIATRTVEYGRPLEWDHGHRRAYGPDVLERIKEAGLHVRILRVDDYSLDERRRWGLRGDDMVFIGQPRD